jgi:peptidoglycan hydrolase-like protein with peptidoglycan-binding domain
VRRAHLLAVAVSALLGVVAGVVGGFVVGGSPATSDPLGVGVPMVNQPCSGQALLVVGWGGSQSAVAAAVARAPEGGARYLDTHGSCRTAWNRPGHTASRYIAYVGPSETKQACQERVNAAQKGLLVTRLQDGNTDPVQCLCYFAPSAMPVLRTTPEPSTLESIYIRGVQDMLAHIGRNPPGHVTGIYDQQTVAAVSTFQHDRGLAANGVVGAETWGRLQAASCRKYKF